MPDHVNTHISTRRNTVSMLARGFHTTRTAVRYTYLTATKQTGNSKQGYIAKTMQACAKIKCILNQPEDPFL
jgi:hypothetical protein